MAGFVRYADSLEAPNPGEQEVVGQIILVMQRETDKVAERERHAVRASHAKSTGLLKGEMRVLDGLPPHLAQGLFARPRCYQALSAYRHERNHRPQTEPASIGDVPD